LHTPDAAAAVRLLELATEHLKQAKAEEGRLSWRPLSYRFVVVLIAVNPLFYAGLCISERPIFNLRVVLSVFDRSCPNIESVSG
jgi:hypothetical protein